MNSEKIIEILAYTLPSVITAGMAYYMLQSFFNEQDNNRKFLLLKNSTKQILPIKLQAYERMTLFLERISLPKLLLRVTPFSEDKTHYETLIIDHIEQEFEHNLTQQIYVSDDCWNVILTAKTTLIHTIRKATKNQTINTAYDLREFMLRELANQESAITLALEYLKKEVAQLL